MGWPQRARAADIWDWNQQPALPPYLSALVASADPVNTSPRPSRVRFFGMASALPTDPLGIDQDDFDPANPGVPLSTPGPDTEDTCDWFTVAIGNDNPNLEFRQHGDPGGVGFYRMATQLQVVDAPSSACSVGFQAFTPAGLAQGGLAYGPTTFCPNLALCQELIDGLAIHGFVGENIQLDQQLAGQFHQRIQYGLALHQPLFPETPDQPENVYVFVQALGRYRFDASPVSSGYYGAPAANLEILPGLHWKAGDNMWWSGGVAVPVGAVGRIEDGSHLQISCMFRF